MSRLLLVDKSAFDRVDPMAVPFRDDEVCLCAITRFELLYSARSPTDFEEWESLLSSYRELAVNGETMAIATVAQRELAARSQHRVPVPDLLIAACAQQHSADVGHDDHHFEMLAEVLHFRPVRVP